MTRRQASACAFALMGLVVLPSPLDAHVTFRTSGPLPPSGFATVSLAIPTERAVSTIRVVLDVPDDFLDAGGRISRLEYPTNWTVTLEKADMPADVYEKEAAARHERAGSAAQGDSSTTAQADTAAGEAAAMDDARRKWIKRIVFDGGSIPVDGFAEFRLSIVVPTTPGRYRFPATQVYEDGTEVKWAELVEGAQRPAPTLAVDGPAAASFTRYVWPVVSLLSLVLSLVSLLARRSPARG